MRIGTSVVVMAIGAVLTFAVETERAEGFNINTAGIILMIAGAVGLVASLVLFSPRRRETVVDDRDGGRTVYRDDTV